MRKLVRGVIAGALIAGSLPVAADVLPFTGSVTGVSNLVGADPTCAPLQFRSAIDPSSTVGTSSLGDFTLSTSTCLSLGGGASFGTARRPLGDLVLLASNIAKGFIECTQGIRTGKTHLTTV